MKTNRITPEKQREYIGNNGAFCPFCGTNDITGAAIEIDGGTAWQPVSCNECGEEWQDSYTLTGATTEFTDYTCSGCGRVESVCSANPCEGVLADRAS